MFCEVLPTQQEVLHVLADVAGLGDRGGVADGEGDLQLVGQRARQQRLAATGRADEQDVGLVDLDVAVADVAVEQPLVVVVHRDRQVLLGVVLPDDVLVQVFLDLSGLGRLPGAGAFRASLAAVLLDDIVAQLDALGANEHVVRPLDQGVGLAPGTAAKTTDGLRSSIIRLLGHRYSLISILKPCSLSA